MRKKKKHMIQWESYTEKCTIPVLQDYNEAEYENSLERRKYFMTNPGGGIFVSHCAELYWSSFNGFKGVCLMQTDQQKKILNS